jgi:hypothetical protein
MVIVVTTVQVLIIALAFMIWYFPVYVVDREQILYQRGSFIGNIKLLNSSLINQVFVKQGRLAKNLNFGIPGVRLETDMPAPRSAFHPPSLSFGKRQREILYPCWKCQSIPDN